MTTAYDDQDLTHTEPVDFNKEYISDDGGPRDSDDSLPAGMPYVNGLLKKKGIGQLVNYCNQTWALKLRSACWTASSRWAFNYATKSGLSVGLDDM